MISQIPISDKTNEIPKLREILEPLDIEGSVVTAHALQTQKETALFLVEQKGADYLFTVKTTGPPCAKISKSSSHRILPPEATTVEKAHGRIEIRQIRTSTQLNHYLQFPYVAQVLWIERFREHLSTSKNTHETLYALTSLSREKASLERLLELVRGHWSIENRVHYVREVTFG